jgi:hypothetical protein
MQDSTKILEYCAAGLGVITNRYFWVDDFESKTKARFLDLNAVKERADVENFNFIVPDMKEFDWQVVIESSGVYEALIDVIPKGSLEK